MYLELTDDIMTAFAGSSFPAQRTFILQRIRVATIAVTRILQRQGVTVDLVPLDPHTLSTRLMASRHGSSVTMELRHWPETVGTETEPYCVLTPRIRASLGENQIHDNLFGFDIDLMAKRILQALQAKSPRLSVEDLIGDLTEVSFRHSAHGRTYAFEAWNLTYDEFEALTGVLRLMRSTK